MRLVEVAARDGLQYEDQTLSVEKRVAILEQLAACGFDTIEAGSFVHPKAVPQMVGSEKVAQHLEDKGLHDKYDFCYLVPNVKGLERALDAHVRHIAVFLSCTESFSLSNLRMSMDDAFEAAKKVVVKAQQEGLKVRGYLSTVFNSIDDEPTPVEMVGEQIQKLLDLGLYEVSLGDTTGKSTIEQNYTLFEYLHHTKMDFSKIALHYHDTFGRALDNVGVAYEAGVRSFDASTGGIGGCPFAKKASGNVAMEKLVYYLESKGEERLINQNNQQIAAAFIKKSLNK